MLKICKVIFYQQYEHRCQKARRFETRLVVLRQAVEMISDTWKGVATFMLENVFRSFTP